MCTLLGPLQSSSYVCWKNTDHFYVCGASIIPEESELFSLCAFEIGINCETELSSHYYSSRLKFPPRCYVCGVFSDLVVIPQEKSQKFQSIHPVCTCCQQWERKREHMDLNLLVRREFYVFHSFFNQCTPCVCVCVFFFVCLFFVFFIHFLKKRRGRG